MGHLKEKYTKEYFTGKDERGNILDYGVTLNLDDRGNPVLRKHDKAILDQLDFKGRNVLGLGIGRGEEICYAAEHGASYCVGVDFSKNAIDIAKTQIEKKRLSSVKLIQEDAIDYLADLVKQGKPKEFDIVIMLDFVEHVPRKELREILQLLKKLLSEKAMLAVNTPAYKYDNDVLKNGFDKRNLVNCVDTSDTNKATAGMHCNKYTVLSLQSFMADCGYRNVTEAHFFVSDVNLSPDFSRISFAERWKLLHKRKFPIKREYADDVVEYPYSDAPKTVWKKFKEGNLAGISLRLTEEYARAAFEGGDLDSYLFSDVAAEKFSEDVVVFDVGAFMGASSFVFAKILGDKARIVSFEPNEYCRNRLFLNLSHDPAFHGKIEVFPLALGDKNGKIKMNISANIDGGHGSTSRIMQSHSKMDDEMLPAGFFKVDVDVATLDEFVKKNGIVPDIMKIDIEGAEHLMLAGSMETLKKFKPVIYMELHSEFCALACCKFLESANYKIKVLHEEVDTRLMIKAEFNAAGEAISPYDFAKEAQLNTQKTQKRISIKLLEDTRELNSVLQKDVERLQDAISNMQSESDRLKNDNSELRGKSEQLKREIAQLKKEIVKLKTDIKRMQDSLSWRITKPVRKIGAFAKRHKLLK